MTRTKPPKTPYEVRIRTWLWIRRHISRAEQDALMHNDSQFFEASMAMERLDSAEHATMPQHDKVQAMMRHGRVMCERVRLAQDKHAGSAQVSRQNADK